MHPYEVVFLICVLLATCYAFKLTFARQQAKATPTELAPTKEPTGLITVGETVNYRKGRKAIHRPRATEIAKATVVGFRTTRKHRIMVVLANGASKFARPEADVLAVN